MTEVYTGVHTILICELFMQRDYVNSIYFVLDTFSKTSDLSFKKILLVDLISFLLAPLLTAFGKV